MILQPTSAGDDVWSVNIISYLRDTFILMLVHFNSFDNLVNRHLRFVCIHDADIWGSESEHYSPRIHIFPFPVCSLSAALKGHQVHRKPTMTLCTQGISPSCHSSVLTTTCSEECLPWWNGSEKSLGWAWLFLFLGSDDFFFSRYYFPLCSLFFR